MNNKALLKKLSDIITVGDSLEFFASILAKGDDGELTLEDNGFKVQFPDKTHARLYEYRGTIFGEYRDSLGTNCSMVHDQKLGRQIFEEVLEELTAPTVS